MNIEDVSLSKLKGLSMILKGKIGERFEELGITNIFDLVCRSTEELVVETKLKKDSIVKLQNRAIEYLEEKKYIKKPDRTPLEQYEDEEEEKNSIIPTGSEAINDLLDGGIKLGQFYHLWGKEGSGKTQFSHNIAVESIQKNGKPVYWIEVESTFRPKRIIQIAIEKGYAKNEEDAKIKFLSNIIINRCNDTLAINKAVNGITDIVIKNDVKLIIIDGAVGQFRLDFIGLGDLSNRQTELKRFVNRLKQIRQYFNMPFIFTNQVFTRVGIISYDEPVGGHIIGHVSTCTLSISKKGENRKLRMRKDPNTVDKEVEFKITSKGLEDLPNKTKAVEVIEENEENKQSSQISE